MNFTPNNEYNYNIYNDTSYKKLIEKRQLRKESSGLGFLVLLSIFAANFIASAITIISMLFTFLTNMDVLENADPNNIFGFIMNSYSLDLYFAQGIASLIGFVIVGFFYINIKKIKFNNILPLKKTSLKTNYLLISIGFAICMVANVVSGLLEKFFAGFGIKSSFSMDLVGNTVIDHILFFIVIAIVPAIAEEFLFRGVLLSVLRKYGDSFAIFSTAFLFGIMHGNLAQIPFAFIVGIVLGYMVVVTESILPAIILHFLNNGFSVVLSILGKYLPNNVMDIVSVVSMLVIYLLGFISIAIIAKSKDEKYYKIKNSKQNSGLSLTGKEKTNAFVLNAGVIICILYFIGVSFLTSI